MSSREQFEAWIAGTTNSDLHRGIMLDRHENGRYRHLATENKWEAWQEATKQYEAKCAALAAENAGLSAVLMSVIDPSNEPAYQSLGMGCGVEDNSLQTDGYGACEYGWREAMERVYSEVIPEELPETPATDAFLAEMRAQAHKEGAHFVANRMLAAWEAGFIDDTAKNAADIARMILTSTEFMADAPEGDFDRSFADGVLEDIAAQLRKGVQS
ncbi:Eae-like protein [Enterobacter kobei]